MKVKVIKRDIAAGARGDCWNCPIALAIRRASGVRTAHVHVGAGFVIIYGNRRADLPPEATAFVRAFDSNSPVKPLVFQLPDELFQ